VKLLAGIADAHKPERLDPKSEYNVVLKLTTLLCRLRLRSAVSDHSRFDLVSSGGNFNMPCGTASTA
jgi:hypothetical protein